MASSETTSPSTEQLQALESDPRLYQAAEMITEWDDYLTSRTESTPVGEKGLDVQDVAVDFLTNSDIEPEKRSLFADMLASLETTVQYDKLGEAMGTGRIAMSTMAHEVSGLDLPSLGYFADFTILEIERYKEQTRNSISDNHSIEEYTRKRLSRVDVESRDIIYNIEDIGQKNTLIQQEITDPNVDAAKLELSSSRFAKMTPNALAKLSGLSKDQMMNFIVGFNENHNRFSGLISTAVHVQVKARDSLGLSDVTANLQSAKGWAAGIEQFYYAGGFDEEMLMKSSSALIQTADRNRDNFRNTRDSSATELDSVGRSFLNIKEQIQAESQNLLQHTAR